MSYTVVLSAALPKDPRDAQQQPLQPGFVEKLLTYLFTFDARQVRYVGQAFSHIVTVVGSGHVIHVRQRTHFPIITC